MAEIKECCLFYGILETFPFLYCILGQTGVDCMVKVIMGLERKEKEYKWGPLIST